MFKELFTRFAATKKITHGIPYILLIGLNIYFTYLKAYDIMSQVILVIAKTNGNEMGKLGDMIVARRNELGISVRTMIKAMKTSLSATYMTKIEIKDEIPTARTLKLIAKVLELDENTLMMLAVEEKNERMLRDLKKRYAIVEKSNEV